MRAAKAMLAIAGLLLPVSLPAQVFEIGNDGALRTAPGLGPGKAGAPTTREAEPARPPSGGSVPTSDWIVQLGAYRTSAGRDSAWQEMLRQHGDLVKGLSVLRSEAVVDNRRIFRLGLAGFADLRAARAMCQMLRGQGEPCLVRSGAL